MKRLFYSFTLVLFYFFASPAWSAITFDAASTFTDAGVSVLNYSLTVGSCANSIVVVDVIWSASSETITGLTIGGVSATLIDSVFLSDVGNRWLSSYRLLGVGAGSKAIAVTFSGTIGTVNSGARSYCGVNQSVPLGTSITAHGDSAGPATATATSAVGELVISTAHSRNEAFTAFNGTSRYNADDGFSISGQDKAGAATVQMDHSFGAPTQWGIIAVSLKPLAAATVRRKVIVIQ